jgi:hypothetical protein
MVLPSSGNSISILQIATEFGGAAPHALSEYYGVTTGIPVSGLIRISDFYGKSNNPNPPTWQTGTTLASRTINSGSFSYNLVATSDSPIISYTITSSPGFGTLSSLLTDKSVNLTGTTPSTVGNYSWIVSATDTENQSTSRTFTMSTTSIGPTWSSPSSDLGTYYRGYTATFTLYATSDSSVYYSLIYNPYGTASISGSTLSIYTQSNGTYNWTVRAYDAESQYADRTFQMTIIEQPLQVNINGAWVESVDASGRVWITLNSTTVGSTGSGYWYAGSSVGRPNFTITVTGPYSISLYFPDAGTITASVSQGVISQSNGSYWYR